MKRGFLVVVGGALVAIGLAGCGGDSGSESSSSASSSASSSSESASESASSSSESASSSAAAAPGDTVVTIDGQPQDIQGDVSCNVVNGDMSITIGDASSGGLSVILTQADPPVVKSVGLGTFDGSALGYTEGTGMGSAEATVDGSTYHVTGEAFSAQIDFSDPLNADVGTKPFEITATCP